MIEAEAKFVDQVVAKSVDLAGSQALGGVVAVAILKAAAVEHVVEGRGQEVAVVAVAEAGEKIILVADGLVDANIELVLGFAALRDRPDNCHRAELVLLGAGNKFASSWPSGSIGVLVPLLPVNLLVGCPAGAVVPMGTLQGPPLKAELLLRQARIKNLSLISRVAVAVERRLSRIVGLLSLREKRGEISANFGRRGNGGQVAAAPGECAGLRSLRRKTVLFLTIGPPSVNPN